MSDAVAVALIAVGGSAVGALGSYLGVYRSQRTELDKLKVGYELDRRSKADTFKHGKRHAYQEFIRAAESATVDPGSFEGSPAAIELSKLYNAFLFSAPKNVVDLAESYRSTWAQRTGPPLGDPGLLRRLKDAMLTDVTP